MQVRRARGFAAAVCVVLVAIAVTSAYGVASALFTAWRSPTSPVATPVGSTSNPFSPICTTLVKTESTQGYAINTFLSSTSAKIGDYVCINVILQNIDGRNLTVSSGGGLTISYTVTEKNGTAVFHDSCTEATIAPSASGNATTSQDPIGSWSCGSAWDTGSAYDGVVPGPGTYYIVASVDVPNTVGQGTSVAYSTVAMSLTK